MPTDAELLAAAKRGDGAAIDQILDRHQKKVFRFGLRMCGSEEDARDVLQETLLAAFKRMHDFRGDASLSTWLFQIARSFCTKKRRRVQGEPASTVSLEAPEAAAVPTIQAGPDDQAEAREIGALLHAAILALPEGYREAIVLRDVEGLPAEEAARVLGIEVGALKSRLHRARLELREKLAGMLSDPAAPGQVACPGLAAELSAYVGADIDQATCQRIEDHLSRCPRCESTCSTLKRSVALCSRVPGGEVPASIRTAVRQALHAATAR